MRYRTGRPCYSDRIRKKSLGISFLIHGAGVFILLGSPWSRDTVSFERVFEVEMVEITSPQKATFAEPQRRPEPARTETRREEPPPVQRREPVRTEPRARERAVFSDENFRDSLASRLHTPQETTSSARTRTPVEIENIETREIQISDSRLSSNVPDWYLNMVRSRIRENWKIHSTIGIRSTTVSFRVQRTGVIENVVMEVSSGNSGFDMSVINAVRITSDLPAFPQEIGQPYLDIIIEFNTEG